MRRYFTHSRAEVESLVPFQQYDPASSCCPSNRLSFSLLQFWRKKRRSEKEPPPKETGPCDEFVVIEDGSDQLFCLCHLCVSVSSLNVPTCSPA